MKNTRVNNKKKRTVFSSKHRRRRGGSSNADQIISIITPLKNLVDSLLMGRYPEMMGIRNSLTYGENLQTNKEEFNEILRRINEYMFEEERRDHHDGYDDEMHTHIMYDLKSLYNKHCNHQNYSSYCSAIKKVYKLFDKTWLNVMGFYSPQSIPIKLTKPEGFMESASRNANNMFKSLTGARGGKTNKRNKTNKTNKRRAGGENTPSERGTVGFRNSMMSNECQNLIVDDFLNASTTDEAEAMYNKCCDNKRNKFLNIPKCNEFKTKLDKQKNDYRQTALDVNTDDYTESILKASD